MRLCVCVRVGECVLVCVCVQVGSRRALQKSRQQRQQQAHVRILSRNKGVVVVAGTTTAAVVAAVDVDGL